MLLRQKNNILLLLFVSTIVLFVSCQPQVVEIEVTRIVTETIAEEIEIEVTRVVTETETVTEEGILVVTRESSATGSEEDEGSPFEPGSQPKVIAARNDTNWVSASGTIENPAIARFISERAQQIAMIRRLEDTETGYTQIVAVAYDQAYFIDQGASSPANSTISHAVVINVEEALWDTFMAETTYSELTDLSLTLQCDRCATGGTREQLILLWTEGSIVLEMDLNEEVPEISQLLATLRALAQQAEMAAVARRSQLETISRELR